MIPGKEGVNMILSEFEPRTLEISYNTGSGKGEMIIVVQTFMEEQTIVKIKKLLKIIRTSNNPDAEQVIADFCKQWLSQFEVEQKMLANNHVNAKERARNQKVKEKYEKVLEIISQG